MTPQKKRLLTRTFVAAWLSVVSLGLWGFASRDFAPGAAGTPADTWPAESTLAAAKDGYTLVVALHPECPCSRATLEELDTLLAQTGGRLRAYAVYADYPELPQPVAESRNWQRAERITDLVPVLDRDGSVIRQFSALTSGEVRLYGPEGDLRFHGGITGSRGHAGANPGSARVRHLETLDPVAEVLLA